MPNPAAAPISQAEIESRVLYRDAMILVIDKPTGIPVHAGFGGGPNLEQSFVHLTFGLPRAPSLAHRLDRDTSGCLVLGRHAKALRQVGDLFAAGKVRKTYWAIVDGRPKEDEGRIKLALAKITGQGAGWKMQADPNGQPAITDYKVRGSVETPDGVRSWVEFHPHTGRTHQIRVHAALLGCPVMADRVYGRAGTKAVEGQLMLHARAIALPLYPKRDPIRVRAPVPAHMRELLAACGFKGDAPEKEGAKEGGRESEKEDA